MPSRMMAFFVALIVLIGAAAHAQGPSGPSRGFGVSPPSIEVRVSAGAIATAEFTLWNSSDLRSEVYTIDVLDLSQLSTGTIRGVERGQGTRSCAEWLEVPSEVEIPPGGAKVVRLSLRCPPQTKGSYFAMLEVSVKRAESPAQMHVSVRPALSVTIEARVPGSATTHLEPMALQYHPTPEPALILTTKNTGVWRKPVEGDVLIYSGSSAFPMRVGLPYQASGKPYSLYPGMAIDQAIPLPKALRPGTHRVSVRLALTDAAQARKDFELEVAGGTAMSLAREGAKAETDVSLEVDPEVAELDLPPGGSRIVPVKVTNEGGPIHPGDLLVSAVTPGHAMRCRSQTACPCCILGKALAPMLDASGVILVLLMTP